MPGSNRDLIDRLAADARPVRRLASPAVRACGWLVVIAVIGGALVFARADLAEFSRRTQGGLKMAAWLLSVATGATAVFAASFVSFPDRSRRWALLPVPMLVLWLAAAGAGCIGLPTGPDIHSPECLKFILMVGSPITAFLIWRLWRARPLDGPLTGLLAGLGAAGLSAALLQFFHPFAVTALDLAVHLAAVAALLGGGALVGRFTDPSRR